MLFRSPKLDQPIANTVRPQPVILIHGKVLDTNTKLPLDAEITYENLATGKTVGYARSNATTGEYTITLPVGTNYAFRAAAENYITISENMDPTKITDYGEMERNLYMAPIEVGQVVRINNIFFETGKADLKPESDLELDKLVSFLQSNQKVIIEINGHTDNVGDDASNFKLSENRAKAVVGYLLTKSISTKQISAKGFGETKPLATNDTEEGRQQNRRVEFVILKK